MKTVIIGARADGHAKVVLEILLAMKCHETAGFIDDDPNKKGSMIRDYPILGSMLELPDLIKSMKIRKAIVAIGHNSMRRKLTEDLILMGLEIVNAVHPTVHMDSDVKIGYGCYIGQAVVIVTGTEIGNCVNLHTGASIDHDNIIEDGANIAPGVHTAGRVKIGQDAFIGIGSVVIPDIQIGKACIVGAGSVVVKNVPENTMVLGVPAKIVKQLS